VIELFEAAYLGGQVGQLVLVDLEFLQALLKKKKEKQL